MSKEQIRNTRTDYRRGIAAAADFLEVGGWDAWVAGTPYRLSDIVRFKFNLMPRKGLRRLHGPKKVFVTLPGDMAAQVVRRVALRTEVKK